MTDDKNNTAKAPSQEGLLVQDKIKTARALRDSILQEFNSYIDSRVMMKPLDMSSDYNVEYNYPPDIIINEIGYDLRGSYNTLTCARVRTMITARDNIQKIFTDGINTNPATTSYNTLLNNIENELHTAARNQNLSSSKHNKYQAIKGVNSSGVTFFKGRVNNSSEIIGKCFELIALERGQLQLPKMKEEIYVAERNSCTIL